MSDNEPSRGERVEIVGGEFDGLHGIVVPCSTLAGEDAAVKIDGTADVQFPGLGVKTMRGPVLRVARGYLQPERGQ